jgi:hypothetical protein
MRGTTWSGQKYNNKNTPPTIARRKYQKIKKALHKMLDKICKNPVTPKKPF